jgi:hypothetical protein
MLLGDFDRAWRESDAIAGRGTRTSEELWDAEPFDKKRVVIRCLHGYGDAIQFLRYAPMLRQVASRVTVQTHPEMVSLVKRMAGIDQVLTWSDNLPRECWDQQIEVTELMRAFRTSVATIPAPVPYVKIGHEARRRSRANLGGTGRRKVGLLWASSGWNPARCMRLSDLSPLLELRDFDFYSFQRGAERPEPGDLDRYRLHDTAVHSPEIVDTAADLVNMDLLITVDTMAAHLAGALGKPVWTLLPFEADWRWMLGRSDTPWYPTMRLFRQPEASDWKSVVESVAASLGLYETDGTSRTADPEPEEYAQCADQFPNAGADRR